MPPDPTIPEAKLTTFRQVAKLAREGATPGERRAAASRLRKLEERYPGIAAAVKKADAEASHERVRATVRQDFRVPVEPVEAPSDGLLERLLKRGKRHALNWATETIADAIEHGAKQAGIDPSAVGFDPRDFIRNGGTVAHPTLRDLLDDEETGCMLDDVEISEYIDDEKTIAFSLELPMSLWETIVGGEREASEFVAWLDARIKAMDIEDIDEEEEEDS